MNMNSIQVHLPIFDGPLALLLYLIRQEEMDIFDIEIHRITQQYLDYLNIMKQMDLEVAGDFVAMAATLMQIKSEMLLPQQSISEQEEENSDPRRPLVQKLLEYQKYQIAAKELDDRVWLGRDVFARGNKDPFVNQQQIEELVEEQFLFKLISQFRQIMRKSRNRVHRVAAKIQSVASRIMEIKNLLPVGLQVPLRSLLTSVDQRRQQLLVTFLSVLEMAKMGFVRLFQSDNYREIYIEAITDLAQINVSQVEEFDSINWGAQYESESQPE
ncbi:MAG: segregation/condensation protein A [Pseudobdellovibrionaceae bacterium]|nr:segregation/condensation protein A [Pseudobdellovibrionaceae bacterium]